MENNPADSKSNQLASSIARGSRKVSRRDALYHLSAARVSLSHRRSRKASDINARCHGYGSGITLQNGHVTPNPQVFIIYWDPYFRDTPAAVTSMNLFVSDLVTGKFINGLAQYGVGRGSWIGWVVIDMTKYPAPATNPPPYFQESDMQNQLITWLRNGTVPIYPTANEVNKMYLIFPPSATKLELNGQTTGFCGYHQHGKWLGSGSVANDNLFWAMVQGYNTQSPSGQAFVDSISYCVSHELAETFSNPDEQGIISSNGCEIVDICEKDTLGNIVTVPYLGWQVERYWSQSEQICLAPSDIPLVTWFGPAVLSGPPGSTLASDPHPISAGAGPGRIDMVWRSTDSLLWYAGYVPSSGWNSAVNQFANNTYTLGSDPYPVSSIPGRIDLYWRGGTAPNAPNLWHLAKDGGGWHIAEYIGRNFPASSAMDSDPHPVSSAPGRIDVFWRGTDNNLWHDWSLDGGDGYTGPALLGGGPLGSDPHPVSSAPGRIDVFWRGTDNNLWHDWSLDGSHWNGPVSLGIGPLGSDPHPVSSVSGHIQVFWRGTDNNLWRTWSFDGSHWNGPVSLGGGPLGSDPHAVSSGPGHIQVFWRGTDNNLWHIWSFDGSNWNGPVSLGGGPLGSDPHPVSSGPGHIQVFWRGTDNNLWHDWNS